jgi:peptide/nickel transport system ATP-binding protein
VSSLNPRRSVYDIIAEPLKVWSKEFRLTADERETKVREAMAAVGLDYDSQAHRRAHSFSGGQCQRISIARALMLSPDLLICDEPVSALDVSVQAQILNLLEEMKRRYNLTIFFIAHDLAVVKHVSDRVAVMYLGKLCEIGSSERIYANPAHPYTSALLSSVPSEDDTGAPVVPQLSGELPSPLHPPSGCRFRTRCPKATAVCAETVPEMVEIGPDHFAACHHPNAPGPDVGVPVSLISGRLAR